MRSQRGLGGYHAVQYDECFMQVAQQVGVKLAPRDDHDKTFGPCKKGVVFGVEYDTE